MLSRSPATRPSPAARPTPPRRTQREMLRILGALLLALSLTPLAALGRPATAFAAGNLTVKAYNDAGRDGVDTGGAEAGVPGLVVSVYSADDRLAGLGNTAADGTITFPNLPDGDYLVQVALAGSYVVSAPGAVGGPNTNPGLVSRVTVGPAGATVRVGLRPIDPVTQVDTAAPAGTRSITTRIWDDLDSDGAQDANEPGIAGLSVQLLNSLGAPIRTAVEGLDGRYRFDDAPTGSGLSIRVQATPGGYTLTRQGFPAQDRNSDGILASLPNVVASDTGGARGVNTDEVDIGFTRGAASGFVWRDINGDGAYDPAAEPRLNGVTVQLIDAGNGVQQTATTRTEVGSGAQSGVFRFLGVAPGTYRVRVPASEFQAGAVLFGAATPPNLDDRGLINGTTAFGVPAPGDYVETAPFTLDFSNVAGGSNRNIGANFGLYKGSVGDFVWFDLDRNGVVDDPAETGLGLNGVEVFVDDGRGGGTAGDGVRNGGELATVTDNDPATDRPGYYRFDDLPLGPTYRIVLAAGNFAPGGPLEGLGSSTATAGSVGGTPYYFITTANLTAAAPTAFAVDFGLTRTDVGNFVFEDVNGDGFYAAGEPPIPGVVVSLVRASTDTVVVTTTTGPTGEYFLGNLLAVPSYVTFQRPAGSSFVASPQLPNVTVDPRETSFVDYSDLTAKLSDTTWRTPVFTPAAGFNNSGIDAGFYEPVTISGRAFFDTNADDQDNEPAEPGVRGVVVSLLRASDSSTATTATTAIDATGAYTLTNVVPGSYEVAFANPAPANFAFVTPDQPAPGDLAASDVDPLTGRTDTFAVLSGEPIADLDAGFTGRADLSGRIWLDSNGSSTQDDGPNYLPGATATLTVAVNLPNLLVATYNPVDSVVAPAIDADPSYAFAGLPGGAGVTYALAFAPPDASYQAVTANVGADDSIDSDGPTVAVAAPAAGGSLDYDQGYYTEVTITARVFEENGGASIDNQYDPADSGLAGVTVVLETAAGTPVLTSTTDVDGLVSFTVAPGDYRLNIDQADADLGGRLASPGNTDPVAVAGSPLVVGEDSLTDTAGANSFGYYRPSTLRGRVFFDRDLDGSLVGEPLVQGVSVTASGPSTPGAVTTDATGVYTITGLLPGNYTVTFANPDTSNFAFITGGDSDLTLAGPVSASSTGSIALGYNTFISGDSEAGLIGRSTVDGSTFVDGDYSGQSVDADDAALPGVTASLTVTVNIPNRLSTTITRSAATDGGGDYSFDGIPGGTGVSFSLGFAPPAATPAWVTTKPDTGNDATDSDGAAQLAGQTIGTSATQSRQQGYYQPVTITARVFDEDSGPVDNQYQAGNPGIAGVTVTLETAAGATVDTKTTVASTGLVTFTVPPGDYRLNLDQNAAPLAGLVPSWSSDPVAAVGTPFVSGDSSLTDTAGSNSFGYSRVGTVTGTLFFDRNLDDEKAAEPGLAGVTVNLLDSGGTLIDTTTTSATGVYTFTGLAPASYIVEFADPGAGNLAFFSGAAGNSDGDGVSDSDIVAPTTTGRTAAFAVAYGATVANVDGGVVGLSTVSGYTFVDGDYSGQSVDADDADLPGVTAGLSMTVNIPGRLSTTIARSAQTAADGTYSFAGLPGGPGVTYDLSFSPPAASPAWLVTKADTGSDLTDSDGTGALTGLSVAAGGSAAYDRGYYQPVTVTARIFDEQVAVNNSFENGEQGLGGITVTLSIGSQQLVTNASGQVSFVTTPGTNVTLSFVEPAGYVRSPGNGGSPVSLGTLTSGASSTTSFGYYRESTIQGTAWYDSDGDGTADVGEPGMQGITVALVGSTSGTLTSVQTDLAGQYTLAKVLPTGGSFDASYKLCFSTRPGFAFTTKGGSIAADNNSDVNVADPLGCTDSFTIGSGATVISIDAGYVGAGSIGDRVWVDVNADGLQTAGEPGLGGAVVTVEVATTGGAINSANPTFVFTTTSAPIINDGPNYLIGRVPPAGTWRVVSVTAPLGYVPSPTDVGGDDALDSDPVGAFAPGAPLQPADLDFGFYQTTAVGDRVWFDQNGNGALDPGERGVPGVRVDIARDGSYFDFTTTSGQELVGGYSFVELDPGSYSLRFGLPSGYRFTNDGAGLIDADNDNDARQADGTTLAFDLTSGQARATVDAGVVGTGSLSGIAWLDEDRNNSRGAVDTGRVAGVQVTLTLTPTLMGAPLTYSTITAADGSYSFADLPPGSGVVSFAVAGPYKPALPNVGGETVDSDGPVAPVTIGIGQSVTGVDQGYWELGRIVWLPLLANDRPRPELSVSFKVDPVRPTAGKSTAIEVTVTNSGDGPATGFWVDFYINPARPPVVNEPWQELCTLDPCFGLAWFYEGTLQPGQSVTLNSRPASATNPNGYSLKASNWPGFFANGTRTLYAFVDSWNRDATGEVRDPNGALREYNEGNNRAQQSIVVDPGPLPPEFPTGASTFGDFRSNP